MKVDLRQRHVRKGEPCRHPEVCNWCCSMEGLGKDAVMQHWNEVKSLPLALHMGVPAPPVQESTPEAKLVEYGGTTYYVPPSEFRHRILPTLLREAGAKNRAKKYSKATKRDGISPPVIVVTPDWKTAPQKSTTTVGDLEKVIFTAGDAVKTRTHIPHISKTSTTNHKYTSAATIQGNRLGAGYFVRPQYSPGQNQFSGQLCCEWKFSEGVDQQGRFVVAVNHFWDIQQFPERVLYQPWYTCIQSQNPMYKGYRDPIYQDHMYFC